MNIHLDHFNWNQFNSVKTIDRKKKRPFPHNYWGHLTHLYMCIYRPSRLSYGCLNDIHMSEVSSPSVRKMWGVTQIRDMVLVRFCDSCRTALFVCFYQPSRLFGHMGDIHMSEVASLIVRKLWGVTQFRDVRLCDSCWTALPVCFYRPSGLSYGCLNIWVKYTGVK